jgi:hypothetical protein
MKFVDIAGTEHFDFSVEDEEFAEESEFKPRDLLQMPFSFKPS